MKVVRKLRGMTVEFGGEEHSGWLPAGAAQPLPTPVEVAVVDFEILSDGSGSYIFEYHSRNTNHRGDTWPQTLEDALGQARKAFGIEPEEWRPASDIV